ncbi:MAG: MFS transporter [Nitrososphaerales archaeon]
MQYKWTALTVTFVGTLMAGLDTRILIIGLPTIAKELHAGPEEVIWVTQAYVLSSTACLLLIGRITDLFGRVKVYNIGFVIFTVGSALAALSTSASELIAFRALQGIGAGILVTNSSAIITDASPRGELGTMLGINQTAFRIGTVFGLTLSGLILSLVDWQGLFYVNIPIGIFGTVWAYMKLREISVRDLSRKMDWVGFALFSTGLTLVLLAVTFLSYGIAGYLEGYTFLSVGFALIVLFVKQESRIPFPMLDLSLFKIRQFAMGNTAQLLNSLSWTGAVLLSALYLQVGLGYTPLQGGLGLLPLDVTYLVFSFASGKLADRYGSRGLATFGLVITTVCFFAMSAFGVSTPYIEIALLFVFMGVGNGLFLAPNLVSIMSSVPSNRIGIASGFRQTVFQTGYATSYGLVILFITFGIPYASFSLLLQGIGSPVALSAARLEFIDGYRITAIILALIEAVAIIPSLMRGESRITKSIPKL